MTYLSVPLKDCIQLDILGDKTKPVNSDISHLYNYIQIKEFTKTRKGKNKHQEENLNP
jgi:hypothetical protein